MPCTLRPHLFPLPTQARGQFYYIDVYSFPDEALLRRLTPDEQDVPQVGEGGGGKGGGDLGGVLRTGVRFGTGWARVGGTTFSGLGWGREGHPHAAVGRWTGNSAGAGRGRGWRI